MIKEFNITRKYCDCCGTEISTPNAFYNDGTWSGTSANVHGKDYCLKCSTQILEQLQHSVSEDVINVIVGSIDKRPKHEGDTLLFGNDSVVTWSKL